MRINNNISALLSYNALNAADNGMSRTIKRLSAGLRINAAADDAAGLAISEKMRAQIRGVQQAGQNVQDGISMIQTAEGALAEVHDILHRIRELSVRAANDTLTQQDREYIQLEVDALKDEIDSIADTAQFNGKKLLNGFASVLRSSSKQGVGAVVRGALPDMAEGNFVIDVKAVESGRNQIQISHIFNRAVTREIPTDYNGDGVIDNVAKYQDTTPAGWTTKLSEITQFTDLSGNFILREPQKLTLSFEGAGSASVIIDAGDTVETLSGKLNAAVIEASGLPAADFNTKTVRTDGTSGAPDTPPPDADPLAIYGDMIVKGLAENSAQRVFNLSGLRGGGASGAYITPVDDTRPAATYYTESNGILSGDIDIYVGEKFFQSMTPEKWEEAQLAMLRETARAMIYTSQALTEKMFDLAAAGDIKPPKDGSWLHEGLLQYIGGGTKVVKDAFNGQTAAQVAAKMSETVGTGTDIKTSSPTYKASSYLAVRFFDEQTGGKLKDLLTQLSGSTPLDAAINNISGGKWANMAAFRNAVTNPANADFTNFVNKVLGEDTSVDGGFLGGQFASGGAALTASQLAQSLLPGSYKENPFENFGFDYFEMYDYGFPPDPGGGGGTGGGSYLSRGPDITYFKDGMLLLHSNISGSAGRITLSGDEKLLKALGFGELQQARDPVFEASISDAHTGAVLKRSEKFSGSRIAGMFGGAVDITLTNNFALKTDRNGRTDGGLRTYGFTNSSDSFTLHIADRRTVFQTGANEGETFTLSLGDVGTKALGIDRLRLTDRDSAARAVTLADNASDIVSSMRARLGASQNRLEHTVTALAAAHENLSAAESRVRDADMAREMMEFVKFQILSQSGTSMLAQANQLPQNVLSLMR